MAFPEDVEALYHAWTVNDWSESSRTAMQSYNDGTDDDREYLKSLLTPRIAFGTAGLRAEMLPGFANFNHVTVRQAILGLTEYLVEQFGEAACSRGVVVGHDHRAMPEPFDHPKFRPAHPQSFSDDHFSSKKFASLAVYTLQSRGFRTIYLGECHTPLTSFAVRDQKAVAAVMITASHNPKTYNGLKVYWETGCQINHPHDNGIAAAINRSLDAPDLVSLRDQDELQPPLDETSVKTIKRWYTACLAQRLAALKSSALDPVVVTPMHGIGAPAIEALFAEYSGGCSFISWVDSQKHPDPQFPTVVFPNPEEKGALDLALQQADAEGIDTVIAVDPDADRFAAAEKVHGFWHRFTGNEIGLLLAIHVLEERGVKSLSPSNRKRIAMLTTAVSSSALSIIAAREGFFYEETLTGFKWMSNRAQELEQQGYKAVFAYEEALGYMFPDIVYDKDGVAALLEFLIARQTWKTKEGKTPFQKLESTYAKYGYFADANTYVVSPSAESTDTAFASLRKAQREQGAGTVEKPAVLAGKVCKSYRDLTSGVDTEQASLKSVLPVDSKTHMISCKIDDARFTIRASGTEPKVKLYVESRGDSMEDAQRKADRLQQLIIDDWLSALKT